MLIGAGRMPAPQICWIFYQFFTGVRHLDNGIVKVSDTDIPSYFQMPYTVKLVYRSVHALQHHCANCIKESDTLH